MFRKRDRREALAENDGESGAEVQNNYDVNQKIKMRPIKGKGNAAPARRLVDASVRGNSLRNGSGNAKSLEMLVQDLEIHQIELQTQNEELRRSQIETEEARRKYSDLYDFAPIGYFTLNAQGSDSRSEPDRCGSTRERTGGDSFSAGSGAL